MQRTFFDTIYKLAKTDPRIFFIGSDIGFGALKPFKEEMPERFFMEGVSEANVIGMAAGLALERKIPYVHTIATFLTRRCFEQIVLDPGLGFAKRPRHSYEILARLGEFHRLERPLLIGPSRKTFVGPDLHPGDRLEGTLAALAFCVAGGAHILRVHDVSQAIRAVRVSEEIVRAVPTPKCSLTKSG